MERPLMQDKDFEGLVSFVLEICSEAVAAGQGITPVAVVARMKDDHTPDAVGTVDLTQMQEASQSEIAEVVHKLANRPDYDLCCYVAQGRMASSVLEKGESLGEARQRVSAEGAPDDAEPVVMTLVFSKELEGFAMHPLDVAHGRIERVPLEFPSAEHGISVGGYFARPRH
jgi:hypothetical protein